MGIFETVKNGTNMIDVAEHYGIPVRRDSFVNCIFHNDKHPSMKLYKDHYHCFACGAHGDVIAFAAHLFEVSPYEAAKKIAADFRIDNSTPYRKSENKVSLLKEYISVLESNRDKYCPCSPDEDLHPLYVEGVQQLPTYQYYLDALMSASKEERNECIKSERRFWNELRNKLRQSRMAVG
jgi:hypothetical protein